MRVEHGVAGAVLQARGDLVGVHLKVLAQVLAGLLLRGGEDEVGQGAVVGVAVARGLGVCAAGEGVARGVPPVVVGIITLRGVGAVGAVVVVVVR